MGMASLNSYLKKRGRTYYLHYFENGVRQRLSLGTEDVQVAKEKQRVFDSARVRGEGNPLPTQTPLPKTARCHVRSRSGKAIIAESGSPRSIRDTWEIVRWQRRARIWRIGHST